MSQVGFDSSRSRGGYTLNHDHTNVKIKTNREMIRETSSEQIIHTKFRKHLSGFTFPQSRNNPNCGNVDNIHCFFFFWKNPMSNLRGA